MGKGGEHISKGTVESLAGFFISDLNIDCATAVRKAIEHLNESCTFNYVVDGFREWYGINIDSEYLQSILYEADDLLLPKDREQNAIFSLLEKEVPRDEEKIDLAYLQHKYGHGYAYLDNLYRKIPDYADSDICQSLHYQMVCSMCKDHDEVIAYLLELGREIDAEMAAASEKDDSGEGTKNGGIDK